MSAPTRPVVRYHGGKWRLAPWIIEHFPPHNVYVEPFGGGASVLLRKQRVAVEVYNDLDERIVRLFRILRDDEKAAELVRRVELTPYARDEFDLSYESTDDEIEHARRYVVRAMMGHGSRGASSLHRTGFRTARRREFTAAADWARYPAALRLVIERLQGVIIENDHAVKVMQRFDTLDALHYVDPPYAFSTRTCDPADQQVYRHEMSDDDHRVLAAALTGLRGAVVVSGYACDLYDLELFAGWERHVTTTFADGRKTRQEVLWIRGPQSSPPVTKHPLLTNPNLFDVGVA